MRVRTITVRHLERRVPSPPSSEPGGDSPPGSLGEPELKVLCTTLKGPVPAIAAECQALNGLLRSVQVSFPGGHIEEGETAEEVRRNTADHDSCSLN